VQGGCGVGRPFFHVTRCADSVGGGFSTDYGVSSAAASSNSSSNNRNHQQQMPQELGRFTYLQL
jgi:hypothetical protein